MSDDQRDQILKQKFPCTINSEALEKSVLKNKLATATHQEIVDSVAKAEEFWKTKEGCRKKYDDDWFCNSVQKRPTNNERYSDNRRGNSGYRPRNPYPEDRRCHYCDQVGHLQCPQRLEDREKGIERPIAQRNAKKICTNCGKNNHSVQDCRKPKDYKPGTAYDGLPYQTVDRRTYNTTNGYDGHTMENPSHPQYQGN